MISATAKEFKKSKSPMFILLNLYNESGYINSSKKDKSSYFKQLPGRIG